MAPNPVPTIQEAEAEDIGFLHAVLAQVGLPRAPMAERVFTRTNGSTSLRLEAGSAFNGLEWIDQPLPSGTRPRLVLLHCCSEAVRTRSPVIDLEDSVRAFLRRLRIDTGGRRMKDLRQQMVALAACRLTLGYRLEDRVVTRKADPVDRFDAWVTIEEGQRAMWPGELTLKREFFETLLEHAVPLDQGAIASLQNSALALDTYTWLAHRLCRITKPTGVPLSWMMLHQQFGQEYRTVKDFKREMVRALGRAAAAYPGARIDPMRGGVRLMPSPPPVKRKGHVVLLPTPAPAPAIEHAPRPQFISADALDRVRAVAPGWDRHRLEALYLEWQRKQPERPANIDAAFIGWAKRFTKGKPPA